MPDQSDIETALAQLAADALYPNGPASPSVLDAPIRIHRGAPIASTLNADLAAGRVTVSITPKDHSLKLTTRYLPTFINDPAPPSLLATAAGQTATFTGAADPGQLAGLLVDDATYVYRTAAGDTPALVAAALAALVRADRPAQLANAAITLPGAFRVVARTVADAIDTIELRRQQQTFQITIWAPSAALRDAAGALLGATLAAIPFFAASGQSCRLTAAEAVTSDQAQSSALYRRDLLYAVEYPTTATALRPAMLFGALTENGIPTPV